MAKRNKRTKQASTAVVNKRPAQPIVHNITVQPFNRQSQDITSWRNASRAAESQIPRRVYLYDLYHDISTTDGQIIAVWGKRQDAITTANWEFTDRDGNPVDAINEMIDCIGFEDLLKEIIDSKAWGHSMCEASFFINANDHNEFSLYSIPKKHMRPEKGVIVKQQTDDEGININEGIYAKTIMSFGKTKDLGLLLSAAMYSIYKRGSTADWAEFIEIFGRGIIDAEWDGFDETQRQNLAKAIREMGSGGIMIRPAGTTVDIKNNTGNANGQLQNAFVSKMDAYISKVLLGTTETTDSSQSSGYAQAEIHDKQDEKKNESDLQFVRRSLNSQFIPILKAAGFDTKGGTFVIKKDKNLNKTAYDIHKSIRKDLGVPIDDDFFYEEYGIRKPDNYEELKNQNSPKPSDDPKPEPKDNEDNDDKAEETQDKNKKLSWLRQLLRLFHHAPTQQVGAIKTVCCGNHHTIKLVDKELDVKQFAQQVWKAKGETFLYTDLFNHYSAVLLSGFESGWESAKDVKLVDLGFDYKYTDPKIQTAWELNLFKFSAIRASYQSAEVNALFRKSKSFDEFYRLVKKQYGVNDKNHLRTEYNTANAAGEAASTYYRLLDQVKIFPYWEYRTQLDDKVRKSHEMLNGCIFRFDDPVWQYIMPPNGWNCRCYIVPRSEAEVTQDMIDKSNKIMEEFYNSEGWQAFEDSGFAHNMGDTKEVFSQSQQYSKAPDKVLDSVGQMYYDDWKLQPIQERQQKATQVYTEAEDRSIIAEFVEKHKVNKRLMQLEDYKGRSLDFYVQNLHKHTKETSKYADRHKYLPALEEAISAPDEVWINNDMSNRFDSYIYIKFYKNIIIKVICTLDEKGNLKINTWYDIEIINTKDKNKMINDLYRHRRGLLIKQ